MKKFFALLGLLLAVALPTFAQSTGMVTVQGSLIHDASNNPVSNATISFAPVNTNGAPLSFRRGGSSTGQIVTNPITTQVTNGGFTLQLPDTALTFPANVCFSATVVDNVSSKQLLGPGYGCVQPTYDNSTTSTPWCAAGLCNFDNYLPFGIPALPINVLPSLALGSVTTLPPGSSATASLSSTQVSNGVQYTMNLGIPTGAVGCVVGQNCLGVLALTGGTLTGSLTGTQFNGPLSGNVTGNVTGIASGNVAYSPSGNQSVTQPANSSLTVTGGNGLNARVFNGTYNPVLYATGGSGTKASPWTGWDTALTPGPNSHVVFPCGWFSFSTWPSSWTQFGINIEGSSQGCTYLVSTGTDGVVFAGNNINDIQFHNFHIYGNGTTTANGLHINGIERSSFRDLRIWGVITNGFWCDVSGTNRPNITNDYTNISVSNNQDSPGVSGAPQVGMRFDGGANACTNSTVIRPIVEGTSVYGIQAAGAQGMQFISGTIENMASGCTAGLLITGQEQQFSSMDLEQNPCADIKVDTSNANNNMLENVTAISASQTNLNINNGIATTVIGGLYTTILLGSSSSGNVFVGTNSASMPADNSFHHSTAFLNFYISGAVQPFAAGGEFVPIMSSGTPTAGQTACVKSIGPPVVVGFCTGSFTGTACTCN